MDFSSFDPFQFLIQSFLYFILLSSCFSFFSYVVYCGLVFVILSQPYMHHQFGKDWTSKSPVRLFQRVYNYAERIEQEVVLLSQVSEMLYFYFHFAHYIDEANL